MNRTRTAAPIQRRTQPMTNQQNKKPTPFDRLSRLVEIQSEIERLEAEAESLREALKNYLADLPEPVLSDEIGGYEARLVTISRRSIDASKVPPELLATLAERDLLTVKVAAAPVVPPSAVSVATTQQLRIRRLKE